MNYLSITSNKFGLPHLMASSDKLAFKKVKLPASMDKKINNVLTILANEVGELWFVDDTFGAFRLSYCTFELQ